MRLREKLEENVSVDFVDTPLKTAIALLAEIAQIDIRLDAPELREMRVREREPVTLQLTDRKLETVLRALALALDLELDWILRDGVLWITSSEHAEEFLKTAVYDVRDLCRDADESDALLDAVELQAEPDSWDPVGSGTIEVARPGVVVVNQTERLHREVLDLLGTYRTALRSSKRRGRVEDDPNRIITTYYRMHANVAQGLSTLLPQLVRPESWKSEAQPEALGELILVSSVPELSDFSVTLETKDSTRTLAIARAVLIIRQTRTAHDEIKEVIRRVQQGDPRGDRGMGGGGGGGFGGGFSVPSGNAPEPPD